MTYINHKQLQIVLIIFFRDLKVDVFVCTSVRTSMPDWYNQTRVLWKTKKYTTFIKFYLLKFIIEYKTKEQNRTIK